MRFTNDRYTVEEDDKILQPHLILSHPSPFVETVLIRTLQLPSHPFFGINKKFVCIPD